MFGLLVVVAAGLVGVGWVLNIANNAPGINQLRPSEPGATSVVYAADGTRLGFI